MNRIANGRYVAPVKYTEDELDQAALADLETDIRCAEDQARNGPYYPEKGLTREGLTEYAAKCRAKLERLKAGGAHKDALKAQ